MNPISSKQTHGGEHGISIYQPVCLSVFVFLSDTTK